MHKYQKIIKNNNILINLESKKKIKIKIKNVKYYG